MPIERNITAKPIQLNPVAGERRQQALSLVDALITSDAGITEITFPFVVSTFLSLTGGEGNVTERSITHSQTIGRYEVTSTLAASRDPDQPDTAESISSISEINGIPCTERGEILIRARHASDGKVISTDTIGAPSLSMQDASEDILQHIKDEPSPSVWTYDPETGNHTSPVERPPIHTPEDVDRNFDDSNSSPRFRDAVRSALVELNARDQQA